MRRVNLPQSIPGALFLSGMPGRFGAFGETRARWERNRIDLVVCLTEQVEIHGAAPEYHRAVAAETLQPDWIHFPIQDFDVPGDREDYLAFVDSLAEHLRDGRRILVHCFGGIGRTGMTAVSVLVRLGVDFDTAVQTVAHAGSHPERTLQLELCRWMAHRSDR